MNRKSKIYIVAGPFSISSIGSGAGMRRVSEPDIFWQASQAMAKAMTQWSCRPAGEHSHEHTHEPQEHSHDHLPDVYHQHEH